MHKETVTYINYDGEERQVTVHFNLDEREITKIQLEYYKQGGVQKVMNDAIESDDPQKLVDFIEMLVQRSYGIKSADGEDFIKSPELIASFEGKAYYSPLYMMLFQDEGKRGAAFIRSVLPADLIAKAEANVRAEGDLQAQLDAQRAAEAQVRPDARSIFDQQRAASVPTVGQVTEPAAPTIGRQEFQAPVVPSQQYQPQNQPSYPQVQPNNDPVHTGPQPGEQLQQAINTRGEELLPNQVPPTGIDGLRQVPVEEGNIARPPHESGPGFEAQQ